MKREIKFKAYCYSTKKIYQLDGILWSDNEAYTECGESLNLGVTELMQYTGLKDKNGVEIYEGDILQIEDCYEPHYIVAYHAPEFCLDDSNDGTMCDLTWEEWEDGEVIGNIYQNKELLK